MSKIRAIFYLVGSPVILTRGLLDYCPDAQNHRTTLRYIGCSWHPPFDGEARAVVHRRAVAKTARPNPWRAHEKPIFARQEIRNLPGGRAGRFRYRSKGVAPPAWCERTIFVRVSRSPARSAGGRAGSCDTVRRHQ